jgi:acyl-CoA thioester hydrolase
MHETEVKVRFSELDPYGHVNHAVYLTYFETARVEALDALGLGLGRLRSEGFHLVVVDVSVRFHAPARHGDVLNIQTEIAELRPASCRWRQRILRDGTLIASAELRGAVTDLDGRVCRAPAHLGELLAALHKPAQPARAEA